MRPTGTSHSAGKRFQHADMVEIPCVMTMAAGRDEAPKRSAAAASMADRDPGTPGVDQHPAAIAGIGGPDQHHVHDREPFIREVWCQNANGVAGGGGDGGFGDGNLLCHVWPSLNGGRNRRQRRWFRRPASAAALAHRGLGVPLEQYQPDCDRAAILG